MEFRNIVVPTSINQSTIIDDVIESIINNLKSLESKECVLEVEAKLGYINVFSEHDLSILQSMEQISIKNYIDLNVLNNFRKQFVSTQQPEMFYKTLNYFENVFEVAQKIDFQKLKVKDRFLHDYLENFKTSNEEITIDYILEEKNGKKRRLTLNPFSGETFIIEKTNKRHFEILHNKLFYRLSLNQEKNLKESNSSKENLNGCKFLRIKHRKIFSFQYMEYDFTVVISLTDNDLGFSELMNNRNNEELQIILFSLLSDLNLECKKTFEVEVELKVDNAFFKSNLGNIEIARSLVMRYLRNVESLYNGEFQNIFYSNYVIKSQAEVPFQIYNCPAPLIGNYMNVEAFEFWKQYLK